jgi:hypothetical protein
MRRLLLSVFALFLVLSLPVSLALAQGEDQVVSLEGRTGTVQPLGEIVPIPIGSGGAPARQDCYVGNINNAEHVVSGWFAAPEEYKYVFDPVAIPDLGCLDCPGGFDVTTVHMLVRVPVEGCTLVMSVNVESADLSDPGCPMPGPVECESGLVTVHLDPGATDWIVPVPIDCNCLSTDGTYVLGVWFESASCPVGLITDALPSACTSWNNSGAGWVDLVTEAGFPGNIWIYADATCHQSPSPTEQTTWGTMKELYK